MYQHRVSRLDVKDTLLQHHDLQNPISTDSQIGTLNIYLQFFVTFCFPFILIEIYLPEKEKKKNNFLSSNTHE